VTAELLVK